MKVNKFGRAKILTPDEINLLFSEGFTKPRDRAIPLGEQIRSEHGVKNAVKAISSYLSIR